MAGSNSYRRPAFPNRPWVRGKLYDDLARSSILHCDAYVFLARTRMYLQLDWRIGGRTALALDTWLIEPDGLTPVWDMPRSAGVLTYYSDPAIHARVVKQANDANGTALNVTRVSLLCHYIDAREIDVERGLGLSTPRKPYVAPAGPLPDIL